MEVIAEIRRRHLVSKGSWKKRLPDLLQTQVALGRAGQVGETWRAAPAINGELVQRAN